MKTKILLLITLILFTELNVVACGRFCAKPQSENFQTAGWSEIICCGGLILVVIAWMFFSKRKIKE